MSYRFSRLGKHGKDVIFGLSSSTLELRLRLLSSKYNCKRRKRIKKELKMAKRQSWHLRRKNLPQRVFPKSPLFKSMMMKLLQKLNPPFKSIITPPKFLKRISLRILSRICRLMRTIQINNQRLLLKRKMKKLQSHHKRKMPPNC